MAAGHLWSPITDLPADWTTLHVAELEVVQRERLQARATLRDPERLHRFQDRLGMLWAVETGLIERLYQFDRGVTETLINLGLGELGRLHQQGRITADAALLIEDQRHALDFVFAFVREERTLTSSYIRELHQLLTRNQETTEAVDQFGSHFQATLLKGEWKHHPNNPTRPDGRIHQYCPPILVQGEIDQLLVWHDQHTEMGVPPEIEAAWLHHRFAQIHPFQDGNGRVARALATLVFLRADYLPLAVRDEEHRNRYLDALEAADDDDLAPLVTLFAEIQVDDLRNAIAAGQAVRGGGLREQIQRAAERAREALASSRGANATDMGPLVALTLRRLEAVAEETRHAFAQQGVPLDVAVTGNQPDEEWGWGRETQKVANAAGYDLDLHASRHWVGLQLRAPELTGVVARVIVSFHRALDRVPGVESHPVVQALLVLTRGAPQVVSDVSRLGTAFWPDAAQDVLLRYADWLDENLEQAVEVWRRGL